MEVAPQELAQLLKLAGVGVSPEPDMPEPEMASEPEVSVMAIPSDDGAPVGGGCGAPEPKHDHGDMRSIIDMLQGGGEEPIEEAPPKDDYENASNEFTGHPVDVVGTYDQYSYEPAKNSGMQRRTNSYGDNPLREEDLIKEYTEFKKFPLFEVDWSKPNEVEAEYKRLGLDQGDDPLGGWWDTQGMSDLQIRKAREDRIKQAYKDNEVDKQQADFGRGSEGEDEGAAAAYGINTKEPGWEDKLASAKQAEREQSDANVAAQKLKARQQAEYDEKHAGEGEAYAQLQDPSSKAAQQQHKQALDNLDQTTVAQSRSGENSPAVVGAKDRAAKQAARVASLDRQKLNDPNEIRNIGGVVAGAGDIEPKPAELTNITPPVADQIQNQNQKTYQGHSQGQHKSVKYMGPATQTKTATPVTTGTTGTNTQGGADQLARSGNYRNPPAVSAGTTIQPTQDDGMTDAERGSGAGQVTTPVVPKAKAPLAKVVQQSTNSLPPRTQQQIATQARIDGDNSQLATPPENEIKGWKAVSDFKARKNAQKPVVPKVATPDLTGVDRGFRQELQKQALPAVKPVAKKTVLKPPQLRSSKYGDGLDRLKILAGI